MQIEFAPANFRPGNRFVGGKQNRATRLSIRNRVLFDLLPYHLHRIAVSICEGGQQMADDHEEESSQEEHATPKQQTHFGVV